MVGLVRATKTGRTVIAITFISIEQPGKIVDTTGPGQILQVLGKQGNRLQISRGQPGWIADSSVLPLDRAESFFQRVFASGAGASDYLARGNVRMATGKMQDGLADLKRALELAGSDKLPYLEALAYGHMKL